jgi:hypothetical protein
MRNGALNSAAVFLLDPRAIIPKKLGLDADLFLTFFFASLFERNTMVSRRKKTADSQGKRGAQDHFTGFKLEFLNSRTLSYQQSLDGSGVGQFYDKISLDFLAKFGHDDDFAKDPAADPPNPWDLPGDMQDPEIPDLTEAEAEIRTARYNKLRKVSH